MAGISAGSLIAAFRRMHRERWRYRPGAAEEGTVDCSGAFAWAFERLGGRIAHGSNAIARQFVDSLEPIKDAQPGMAAFRLRRPGDPGYALPEKYRKGGSACNGDLNDYYHIGLVDEDGAHVLNAQGERAGFTRTALKDWACVGALKGVDYGKGDVPMQKMTVTAENGSPVKVRVNPDAASARADTLPVGTEVMAGEDRGGWRQITYGADGAGWMMSRFLKAAEDTAEAGSLAACLALAEELRDRLAALAGVGR